MRVTVYQIRDHNRSRFVCEAMLQGIKACGENVRHCWEHQYQGPQGDVAVFYGLAGRNQQVFADYQTGGRKAVYIDLGYFGRRQGGRFVGYHKLVVNARHPNRYFQRKAHDNSRLSVLGVVPRAWRQGGNHILLAGMGMKGATAEGYAPEQWEREAIAKIKAVTDRPIIYRPKPSWKSAPRIAGVGFSPRTQHVNEVLDNCWAVVTHHSNVAVDGLVLGIPAFCWHGVAQPLSLQDLGRIESPIRPDGREQWLNDLAFTQFNIAEMRDGVAWRHLRNEGLV